MKVKKIIFFIFGLTFFLFPGQNYFLTLQNYWVSPAVGQDDLSLPISLYPVNVTGVTAPETTAGSVVVLDEDSAVLLYGKNERMPLLPASTSKIMTALVALDYYPLDKVLTVPEMDVLGQSMKLFTGEKMTAQNLLYGLLVFSANDAATVLAQNYPGGTKGFVAAMNQKAKDLSLNNTYFANPTGLDSDRENKLLKDFSYTTSWDLAMLIRRAIKNPTFSQMIATRAITVTDAEGKINHPLTNLNQLLGKIEGVQGGKTGWTQEAGECLASYTYKDGHGIIVVVLKSQDRFGDSTKYIEWALSNHKWQKITPAI